MADININSSVFRFKFLFVDGDDRTFNMSNAINDTITREEILNLQTYIQENNLILGDKTGATFGRIGTVVRVNTHRHVLDISGL